MVEIKGTFATAICFTKHIEETAVDQIRAMCNMPVTDGSKVRIMPDVHAGKGCTIGTTMTVIDKVVPNIVGVDIGCGMYTVPLDARHIDFAKVDEAAHYIPSGMNVWNESIEPFDLKMLRCFDHLKSPERLECSLGTLGG
ncbi:MAG: RtcB family protein, partial [Bacillota bacterium]|nr:RtcB family protein [Bacillota bacterium]